MPVPKRPTELEVLVKLGEWEGRPPTTRQLAEEFGVSQGTMKLRLTPLLAQRLIKPGTFNEGHGQSLNGNEGRRAWRITLLGRKRLEEA